MPSNKTEGVKFIRVKGRVVPIHGKGSAPKGVSKRYGAKRQVTPTKKVGAMRGAVIGGAAGLVKSTKFALIGAGLGAALGSIRFTKKGKGESDAQLAKRLANKKGCQNF